MAAQYAYQPRDVHILAGWHSAIGPNDLFLNVQLLSGKPANDHSTTSPTVSSWQQPLAGTLVDLVHFPLRNLQYQKTIALQQIVLWPR